MSISRFHKVLNVIVETITLKEEKMRKKRRKNFPRLTE